MTSRDDPDPDIAPSAVLMLRLVEREHGPILGGPVLWRMLGYTSPDAFRKAVQRGTVPVPTFSLPHRRGRFAQTADVVRWLEQLAHQPPAPGTKEVAAKA